LFQIKQLVQHFERLPKERDAAGFRRGILQLPAPVAANNAMRANWPGRPRKTARKQVGASSSRLARPAEIVRRHRRELLRALGHLAHGAGDGHELPHRPSHALRIRRAGVGVASRRAARTARATATQSRENFSLQIFPEPALRKARTDYFGNQLCFFSIQEVHQQAGNHHHSRVTGAAGTCPPQNESTAPWEGRGNVPRPVSPEVVEPYQFVFDSPQVRASVELADYARESFGPDTPLLVGARI
jgi:hypothetical protein